MNTFSNTSPSRDDKRADDDEELSDTIREDTIREDATLDTIAALLLGAIDVSSGEQQQLHALLRRHLSNTQGVPDSSAMVTISQRFMQEYAAMVWTTNHLPALVPSVAPPLTMKSKILAAIHEQHSERLNEHINEHHSEFIPEFDAKGKSVYTIAHDETGWLQHPVRGIEVKPLAGDKERGYSTLLMRLAPGTTYPTHSHAGAEQCFVVQGSINVMGKTLNAGDLLSTQAHAEHGDIFSTNGATVLLIVAREDFRKSVWKVATANLKHRLKQLVG